MSAVHTFGKAIASTILVASVFSGAAFAQHKGEPEYGEDGMYKQPICDYSFRITKPLATMLKEVPTGLKASNDKWDMEIYANTQTGTWTLVGKSKDPAARSTQLCTLASSIDRPYNKEKWFVAYFPKPETAPKIATANQDMKPSLQ